MEIKIALNTIIYIMIFIFPGILFRKFLFRREYSKEFDKGNLFERTIWTVFTSIVMLFLVAGIFTFLSTELELQLVSYISYDTIKKPFSEIASNKLPDIEFNVFWDFTKIMMAIYGFSIFLGWTTYQLSKTRLSRKLGLFKYDNYWQSLVKGKGYEKGDDSLSHLYTIGDILVDAGGQTILYTGRIENYYISTENLQIQTIVISDVKRYAKDKSDGKLILKPVPGHNLIIEKEKIINYNFTYVYEKKDDLQGYIWLYAILNFVALILIVGVVSSLFISGVNIYFSTIARKIVFVSFGASSIILLNNFFKLALSGQITKIKAELIFSVIFSMIPFLWIFNYTRWYFAIIGMFVWLLIFSIILSNKSTVENKNVQ